MDSNWLRSHKAVPQTLLMTHEVLFCVVAFVCIGLYFYVLNRI